MPSDADATIVALAAMPKGAELFLLRDGREVARGTDEIRHSVSDARGAFRVEVRIPGTRGASPMPWLISNPIYFGVRAAAGRPGGAVADHGGTADARIPPFPWRIEKDGSSSAILRTRGNSVELEYGLADGPRGNQFVALATDLAGQPFEQIELSLAADKPMRVSVQVRRSDGARWGRAVYVDTTGSLLHLPLSSLKAVPPAAGSAISSAEVTSVLLVVDLTNASPGHSGVLTVRASALLN
jgi:hypothetical protein